MSFDPDPSIWNVGHVGYFFKLHPDTAQFVGSEICRLKHNGDEEWIQKFSIEGKKRPCIILQRNGTWFRIWNGSHSCRGQTRSFPVSRSERMREITVELDISAIERSHRRLAGKWCGEVAPLLMQAAYDEALVLSTQRR